MMEKTLLSEAQCSSAPSSSLIVRRAVGVEARSHREPQGVYHVDGRFCK